MIPDHKNRSPEQIIGDTNEYDASGRIFKAISWLDFAKRHASVSALEYAALETRLGIEQLLFQQLVIGVGTRLERKEYKRCKGNAKKLDEIIQKLIPRYDKLVEFTAALAPTSIPIARWDNCKLIAFSGKVSTYLHWSGGLDTTVYSGDWFTRGIAAITEATDYVWGTLTTARTGMISIDTLEPEIKELWDQYSSDAIILESVVQRAKTLKPLLEKRQREKAVQVPKHVVTEIMQ